VSAGKDHSNAERHECLDSLQSRHGFPTPLHKHKLSDNIWNGRELLADVMFDRNEAQRLARAQAKAADPTAYAAGGQRPRAFNALDMVIFVKNVDGSAESDEPVRKQFRVRRRVVHDWLAFLKADNPFQSRIGIDSSALEVLPEDSNGGIDHLPQLQSDVEPNGNTSGEISVCVIDGLNKIATAKLKPNAIKFCNGLDNQKMLSTNS
jgi:hypothetical protein